jgi:hypothetical protein
VSSSSADDRTEKKPPSVIVKFGKQDGTYYSKKQDVNPSSSNNKKEKERNHKYSDVGNSNNVSANSSGSGVSTISICKRETKDYDSKSNNGLSSVGQNLSKENDRKSGAGGNTNEAISGSPSGKPKGFSRPNFNETSSPATASDDKRAEADTKADLDKVPVKVEPMDTSSEAGSGKKPTSSESTSNHKSPFPKAAASVGLDKLKVDLKNSDGKSGAGNPNPHGFGRIGGGKVGLDRQSTTSSSLTIEKTAPTSSASSSSSSNATLKDNPAKIIPLLPSVTVTTSNLVKVDLKSSAKRPDSPPLSLSTRTAPDEPRAASPPRINTELLRYPPSSFSSSSSMDPPQVEPMGKVRPHHGS